MNTVQIEKLHKAGNISLTLGEIADLHLAIQKAQEENGKCGVCKTIGAWILKKAAGAGSCFLGGLALAGIFVAADALFVEFDEILIPLEAAIEDLWGSLCGQVGTAVIAENADQYAEELCKQIGLC